MSELKPTPIEEAFQAKVIADSISVYGIRIITLQLRYPRFIHAEFMTHRVFSRNARSSRAVPTKRLAAENIYIPHMMANQSGMQSFKELPPKALEHALEVWFDASKDGRYWAVQLQGVEVHKQWANRLLEPFGYIDVVVTSTDWDNFFNLRDHPAAMPEIQHLAQAMRNAIYESTPVLRYWNNTGYSWHLPYITDEERGEYDPKALCLFSTARCARVSYKPFDADDVDYIKDAELAKRLMEAEPLHASPAEHQAMPDYIHKEQREWANKWKWGNFFGWQQHRKFHPNENYEKQDRSIYSCLERARQLEEEEDTDAA